MKTLPSWMYGDPAAVAERIESIGLRAEERERVRRLEQAEAAESAQRSFFARMGVGLKRVIAAPPEIQLKRARIQRLARAAMKELK